MKFLTFEHNGREYFGIKKDGGIVCGNGLTLSREYTGLLDYIRHHTPEDVAILDQAIPIFDEEDISLRAPIPHPPHDIICVGKNYVGHIEELGGSVDPETFVSQYFGKRVNRVLGDGEPVKGAFDLDESMDYEVELAVVIGKKLRNATPEEAVDGIFGFSVFNDLSSRGIQMAHVQWYRGKGMDDYSVMGPYLVTKDEYEWPLNLELTSTVNGQYRQRSNTSVMIRDVVGIIVELSRGLTLEPGDIIATGTPEGVGMGFDPPKYLKAGDVVSCTVEGIGTITNDIT